MDSEFKVPLPKTVGIWKDDKKVQGKSQGNSLRSLALRSASEMVGQVAPAQLERAVAESTSYIYSLKSAEPQPQPDTQPSLPESSPKINNFQPQDINAYQQPEWGGPPSSQVDPPYSIEVLKSGQIIAEYQLNKDQKGFYTFGKLPQCDFATEHPSCSRFHAVLQFNRTTNAAFVWDNGSTHGTFLNKSRVKQGMYVPVRVGDMLVFGMSSRKFVIGGPEELKPEEGLNRQQRRQFAMLKAAEKVKEKDKMKAEVQMKAALKGEVNWGMQEDFGFDMDQDADVLDWKAYAETKGLTEKQEKLASKIRQRDWKIQSLEKESLRINTKGKKELGLTPGQAATLARNEQSMQRLQDEKEDLEELLIEYIRDSIKGLKQKVEEQSNKLGKKRKNQSDEEYEGEDDDDFYDRTKTKSLKNKVKKSKIISPESLYGEKAVLEDELNLVKKRIQEFHSENNLSIQQSLPRSEDVEDDLLDSYMRHVSQSIDTANLQRLQERQVKLQNEISRLDNLLEISDPQRYFKQGSKIAEAAKAKAIKQKEIEFRTQEMGQKLDKEREEKEKMQEFVMDEKECGNKDVIQSDSQHVQNVNVDSMRIEADPGVSGGLEVRKETKNVDTQHQEDVQQVQISGQRQFDQEEQNYEEKDATIFSGFLSRKQLLESKSRQSTQQTIEQVLSKDNIEMALDEDLQLLQRAIIHKDILAGEDENNLQWKPPEGWTGDGRQEINDRFGY